MVISVYEKEKIKRLNEKNIVIETLYYNPNNSKGFVFVRSTDGKMNDVINYKAIKEKRYFYNDECIFTEKKFDSDFLYNIVNYEDENEKIICPNCGNSGKVGELIDGCPYCGTIFNFGVDGINNSKKQLVYQFHTKSALKIYFLISFICALLMFLSLILMKIPVLVSIVFSIPVGLVGAQGLSIIAIVIISVIRQKKNPLYGFERYENIMWKISKDEKVFYNNFTAELMIKLYEQKDLIDFEIIDYCNVDFLSEDDVVVTCKVREVYYNDKIDVFENTYKIKTKYNSERKKSDTTIQCLGCGSSISVTQKKCNHCDRINDFRNEWIIDSIEKI